MLKRILIGLLVASILFGGAAAYAYNRWQDALKPVESEPTQTTLIEIEPGSSTADIAALLEQKGVIREDWAFSVLSRVKERDGQIMAGWYRLSSSMDAEDILEKLISGETATRRFTVPEGLTVDGVIDLLVDLDLGDEEKFWDAVSNRQMLENWLPDDYEAEKVCQNFSRPSSVFKGYLFPETYTISYGYDESDIINLMVDKFAEFWTDERIEAAHEQGLSIHEAVTLASIVEREARVDEERAKIAAVFLNRLERDMTLGACSTILYVQGRRGGAVYEEDTEIDSPYNTYANLDLPPGPIANPGFASLEAVLNPASTDYLYFVSRGDGTHAFAETYQQHQMNKTRYLD